MVIAPSFQKALFFFLHLSLSFIVHNISNIGLWGFADFFLRPFQGDAHGMQKYQENKFSFSKQLP